MTAAATCTAVVGGTAGDPGGTLSYCGGEFVPYGGPCGACGVKKVSGIHEVREEFGGHRYVAPERCARCGKKRLGAARE